MINCSEELPIIIISQSVIIVRRSYASTVLGIAIRSSLEGDGRKGACYQLVAAAHSCN